MGINTDFYTNPHSFAPSRTFPDIKIADWTYTGAMEGSIGALTMQKSELGIELDPSIIPWKINERSDVMRRQYAYGQQDFSNNPWSAYTQVHNGIKRGYRFILGGQGDWSTTDNPPNVPNGVPIWNSRHTNWTDLTTYSTTGFDYEKYLVPFVDFNYQNTIAYYKIAYVEKWWYPSYPDEAPLFVDEIAPSALTDEWLTNNFVVGFKVYIYSGGTQSPDIAGYKCQFIPFDPVHPSLYAANEFVPYGKNTLQYWNSFLGYSDSRGGISIGGYYGRWSILNNSSPTAEDWYNYGNKGGYGADKMPETLGGVIDNAESDELSGEYSLAYAAFKDGGSSWSGLSGVLKNYNTMTANEIKSYMRTQLAYLGFIFTEWLDLARFGIKTDFLSYYYVPEIDSDGVTTGNYKPYPESDYDNTDWTTGIADVTPYDPEHDTPDQDPTDWDEDQTSILSTTTGDPSYGTKEYLMTETALVQLLKALEELKVGEAEGDIAEGYCEKAFGYTDPIKAIVSVIKYPFDMINNWIGSGAVVSGSDVGSYFSIANAQIAVSVGTTPAIYEIVIPSAHDIYEISWNDSVWKYGRATLPYFQKFENFLAYEPYCTAALYVPFAGSVRLDPEVYVGHTVGVDYYVSPLDGTCKAYILRDNLVIDTLTGNIGTSIEINSSDELAKANNINLLNSNIQAQKMNLLKQAASFSVGSAVNAGLNPTTGAASMVRSAVDLTFSAMQTQNTIDRLEYQIETTQTPFKQLQPGGGYLSSCDEWGVRLVAYRPEPLPGYSFEDWKQFPTLCGFACLLNDTLDNFTGFTKCATVKLDGIAATAQEKQQIRKLLQSGVYL